MYVDPPNFFFPNIAFIMNFTGKWLKDVTNQANGEKIPLKPSMTESIPLVMYEILTKISAVMLHKFII